MGIGARSVLSLAGFLMIGVASALVTVCFHPRLLRYEQPLGGATFGAFMAACFWAFSSLRSIWKALIFIAVSTVAAYVSFFLAFLAISVFPSRPPYIPEAFVGGFTGAFFVLTAALILFVPGGKLWRVLVKSLSWSSAGGLLGVIGVIATPVVADLRTRLALPFEGTAYDASLVLTWQIGMSLVLAVMLWIEVRPSSGRLVGQPP